MVAGVTGAARIREIANRVGTNTTQGAKIAVTTGDDTNPDEITADTEAPNVNCYREENLLKE